MHFKTLVVCLAEDETLEGEGVGEGEGWRAGGEEGRNTIKLIRTCFLSEDSETCPLTTGIDKRKQSSIKEKGEREETRKALIDMRASLKKEKKKGSRRERGELRRTNSSGKLMLIGV